MNPYLQRSALPELIDAPGIPFKDWAECLRELNIINSLLGGHAITIAGVQQFTSKENAALSVMEIGCGGGDNLKAIHRWNTQRKLNIRYSGVDLNAACIAFAKQNCASIPHIALIASDYRDLEFGTGKPDLIFSSLFCHHFTDAQLVDMLRWMKQNTNKGFFINDLQRHPFAFHSIKWLTALFSRSYLVKNDAPISVMRGFKKQEWESLLQRAGITRYSISWKWAFRYLIVVHNG